MSLKLFVSVAFATVALAACSDVSAPNASTTSTTTPGEANRTTSSTTTAAAPSVTVTLTKTTLYPGDVAMASWVVRDGSGNVITPFVVPASSNPSVATVILGGQVAGVAPGTAQISVTYGGVTGSATMTVIAKPAGTITVTMPSSVSVGAIGLASVTFRDAAGNVVAPSAVTWTSSNPAVAQAFGGGLYYATAPGTTVIKATSGSTSGSATLTVR